MNGSGAGGKEAGWGWGLTHREAAPYGSRGGAVAGWGLRRGGACAVEPPRAPPRPAGVWARRGACAVPAGPPQDGGRLRPEAMKMKV